MPQPFRIAVCEDSPTDLDQLTRLIEATLGAVRPISIRRYATAEALMAGFQPGMIDAAFLDMYLGGMTGLDAAQAIRAQDERCAIVFTTVSPEFALDSYSVRAAHYLIKPVSERDLSEVWRRLSAERRQEGPGITLIVDRKPLQLMCADILYAEARGKLCRVYARAQTIDTRLTIDQLEHMLPTPPFCRCHRGYIVNFDHVKDVGEDFIMHNGDIVYIRQTERARIRDLYFAGLVDKAKRRRDDAF